MIRTNEKQLDNSTTTFIILQIPVHLIKEAGIKVKIASTFFDESLNYCVRSTCVAFIMISSMTHVMFSKIV